METLGQERDRLLQRSVRVCGTSFAVVSLLIFLVPGVVEPTRLALLIPLFLALLVALYLVAGNRSLLVVLGGLLAGLAIMLVAQLPLGGEHSPALLTALVPLAAGSLSSFSMVLLNNRRRVLILMVTLVATLVLIAMAVPTQNLPQALLIVALGWALTTIFGYWLSSSVPRAARHIYSIGRAHRAERRASETEAQRRQSARLLHDTVLATLTLLAHSGVGVTPEAMQQQAADDARLLRQLRLGAVPTPSASGEYNLEPVEETALGTTLESVKQRFGRMGLEVS